MLDVVRAHDPSASTCSHSAFVIPVVHSSLFHCYFVIILLLFHHFLSTAGQGLAEPLKVLTNSIESLKALMKTINCNFRHCDMPFVVMFVVVSSLFHHCIVISLYFHSYFVISHSSLFRCYFIAVSSLFRHCRCLLAPKARPQNPNIRRARRAAFFVFPLYFTKIC